SGLVFQQSIQIFITMKQLSSSVLLDTRPWISPSQYLLPSNKQILSNFKKYLVVNDLTLKIQDYLRTSNEGPKTDVLNYWGSKMSICPLMAAMARCFLAIPAT
ncbi:uncharacterized protein VP01_14404g1, partial [Puccinia sorghi]